VRVAVAAALQEVFGIAVLEGERIEAGDVGDARRARGARGYLDPGRAPGEQAAAGREGGGRTEAGEEGDGRERDAPADGQSVEPGSGDVGRRLGDGRRGGHLRLSSPCR
jgi:hypothetical protein